MTIYDGETFEHEGFTFRATFPQEDTQETPWEWCDGHGIVSEWTTREKAPGERVLVSERSSKRYYDFCETTKLAKRDGWGLGEDAFNELGKRLGRKPTPKEIIAEAVERDFNYLRGWCNDEWTYICVCVERVDEDGELTGESDLIGMVESSDSKHLESVAREIAGNIITEVRASRDKDDIIAAAEMEAARPDMYQTQ